ncbi:pyruvate, water dikinase regulatory protein [Nosocomiicoccus sp. HMSC059G07]|uniref:pyruvate, water dikinase regulatory protein n=1 Tax=Nosocomiicoccus sp. HMSC059G07 TaxID=1739531 RepID=UPI0008A4167A|nr:pyruvate, water dikinase regulatory protein [Nosocomiicoccus sp. HMSC059G07]OFO51420.1 phosphoenolpyruvate synthase regulatory protein [Nosocomiicoccus sp. HMSC059G07]
MKNLKIVIASDSIGETGEVVARAALSQFDVVVEETNLKRYAHLTDIKDIDNFIQSIKLDNVVVIFTFIKPELSKYIVEKLTQLNIPFVDVMTPVMDMLKEKLEDGPLYEPGRVHKLDADYFKKIEAIEFAVRYDDGRDPSGLKYADIVLIGVSRTSKTPLSQFLAYRGYKVVNIALVPEVELPEQLFEIDPNKCIGLEIDPSSLFEIRKRRLEQLGLLENAKYGQNERIEAELEYFHQTVKKIGCCTINVTNKAIEETASEIIRIMNL